MTLDSRFRDAVDETVGSQRRVDDRLGDLRRLRRHRAAQRAGVALAAVSVVAVGLALHAHRPGSPQPAPPTPELRGGAVLGLTPDGAVVQVAGPRLAHLPGSAVLTGPFGFTRDGTSLVYAADGAVRRRDLRSGVEETLGTCPDRACAVAYNEDASRSAVAVDHYIVVSDEGSGETTTIAIGAAATHLSWSPGSGSLAFVTRRGGSATLEALDVDSQRRSRLVRLQAGDGFVSTPVWAPNGHQIAYVVHFAPAGESGLVELQTVTTIGHPLVSDVHEVDRCVCADYSAGLVWAPDANRIAVTGASTRSGSEGAVLSGLRDGAQWRRKAPGAFTAALAWQPPVTDQP
jgi:hypothetical protein